MLGTFLHGLANFEQYNNIVDISITINSMFTTVLALFSSHLNLFAVLTLLKC